MKQQRHREGNLLFSIHDRERGQKPMRTVLVVDYYFPPMAASAVQRTLGFIRHLSEFGWSPVVLTVDSGDYSFHDVALLRTIPNAVNVHRTASLEPVRFAKRLISRGDARRNGLRGDGRSSGHPWIGPRWIREVERWVLFPDRQIGWLPFAVAKALSVSRMQTIDVIYSSSLSVTSHLIAYVLTKLLGKPWVADFQDPWAQEDRFPSLLHRRVGQQIEHSILRAADRVTFATEAVRSELQRKYAAIPPDKLIVVPSGFDPADFQDVEPVQRTKFTITHFGNFYAGRSPGPFLEALAESTREHRGLAEDTEVLFFGAFDAEMFTETNASLDRHGLRNLVRFEGVVPYRAGLQHLMSSHVLLLVAFPGEHGYSLIPAKLFDYLAAGRTILALTPEGDTARIVRAAKAGVVVDPFNVPAIREAILDLYGRWKDGRLYSLTDPAVVRKFSWKELARQLAATLEDALMGSKAGKTLA